MSTQRDVPAVPDHERLNPVNLSPLRVELRLTRFHLTAHLMQLKTVAIRFYFPAKALINSNAHMMLYTSRNACLT
jgi:hypothetical protein